MKNMAVLPPFQEKLVRFLKTVLDPPFCGRCMNFYQPINFLGPFALKLCLEFFDVGSIISGLVRCRRRKFRPLEVPMVQILAP